MFLCFKRPVAGAKSKGKELPGKDSNLEQQDQNLLCYHYTTG